MYGITRSASHIGPNNSNKTGRRRQAKALTPDHQYNHYILQFNFVFDNNIILHLRKEKFEQKGPNDNN